MDAMKHFARFLTLVLSLTVTPGLLADQTDVKPRIRMITNLGELVIELEPGRAPQTVNNFLTYLQLGWYDGTIFHRVIDGFVIQGGGFHPSLEAIPQRDPIPNESGNGLSNRTGTIAMARTRDPHSASSQFYINLRDNTSLDYKGGADPSGWGYAVFGRVVEGMEVVKKIGGVPTGSKGPFPRDVPRTDVVLEKVLLIETAKSQ